MVITRSLTLVITEVDKMFKFGQFAVGDRVPADRVLAVAALAVSVATFRDQPAAFIQQTPAEGVRLS